MFKFNQKRQTTASQIDSMPITTVIGQETTFHGNISGENTIKIDGNVLGNVSVSKGIILGEKSWVKGNLESGHIIVYGQIDGNVTCRELILKNSAVINGDISTDALEIEMGGKYNGKLRMNQTEHRSEN